MAAITTSYRQMLYTPQMNALFRAGLSAVLLQHLHRILQAPPHPVERHRQRSDFVAAVADIFGRIEISHADAVGHLRNLDDRLDHNEAQQQIEDNDDDDKSTRQRQHEPEQSLESPAERCAERNGHDLGADNFALLPAKSVLRAVQGHHRGRGSIGRAVTGQAGLAADLERSGEDEKLASRRVAGDQRLLFAGVVAKAVDDVGFPIYGSIVEIGWVQRWLAISVFR